MNSEDALYTELAALRAERDRLRETVRVQAEQIHQNEEDRNRLRESCECCCGVVLECDSCGGYVHTKANAQDAAELLRLREENEGLRALLRHAQPTVRLPELYHKISAAIDAAKKP